MKKTVLFLIIVFCMGALSAQEKITPQPFKILNPPADLSPERTRYSRGWECGPIIAPKQWTAKEHAALEKKLTWFQKAKYGLFFHFLAPEDSTCNTEKWNDMVNAVDVEKFADQVKATGAGYVVLAIGQNMFYTCAPNPVLEELWELEPGKYTSKRDLPMDVYNALHKRGIDLMLYIMVNEQFGLPRPKSFTKESDRFENFLKVVSWYSDHYGTRCRGWWIDALDEFEPGYRVRFSEALKTGNPDAIIGSCSYGISEFLHGHCDPHWEGQQKYRKPYYGSWDPDYKIQWHVLQYLGSAWAKTDTAHSTASLVNYATDVVRGGGVITFDVGACNMVNDTITDSFLDIPKGQMVQLLAVKKALKKVKPEKACLEYRK